MLKTMVCKRSIFMSNSTTLFTIIIQYTLFKTWVNTLNTHMTGNKCYIMEETKQNTSWVLFISYDN